MLVACTYLPKCLLLPAPLLQAVLSPVYVQAHDEFCSMWKMDDESRVTAETRRPIVQLGRLPAVNTEEVQCRMLCWLLPFEGQEGSPDPLLNLAARLVTILAMAAGVVLDEVSLLACSVRKHSDREVCAKHLFSVLLTSLKVLAQQTRPPASSSWRL